MSVLWLKRGILFLVTVSIVLVIAFVIIMIGWKIYSETIEESRFGGTIKLFFGLVEYSKGGLATDKTIIPQTPSFIPPALVAAPSPVMHGNSHSRCGEYMEGINNEFCIDNDLVSNRDMRRSKDNDPATNVTWFRAANYCQDVGKRLPTGKEWDAAENVITKRVGYTEWVSDVDSILPERRLSRPSNIYESPMLPDALDKFRGFRCATETNKNAPK